MYRCKDAALWLHMHANRDVKFNLKRSCQVLYSVCIQDTSFSHMVSLFTVVVCLCTCPCFELLLLIAQSINSWWPLFLGWKLGCVVCVMYHEKSVATWGAYTSGKVWLYSSWPVRGYQDSECHKRGRTNKGNGMCHLRESICEDTKAHGCMLFMCNGWM